MTLAPRDSGRDPLAIWRAFDRNVAADPGAIALSTVDGVVSREALATQASELANTMRAAGVSEHGVIALMLPNSVDFVTAFLAAMQLPAIAALASTRYKASGLKALCDGVQAESVLATRKDADAIAGMLRVERRFDFASPASGASLSLLFIQTRREAPGVDPGKRFRVSDPEAFPALVKLSSGSTGSPKPVLWSVANVTAEARNIAETLGLDASDRVLAPVPLFHSYGFDLGVLPMVFTGTSLVIRGGFSPKGILADLAKEAPSVFLGVPAMYRVLNRMRLDPAPDLSAIRYLLSCSARLPVDELEAFERRFNAPICQHYGSSETGGITMHVQSEILNRPGSVGRPMQNVAVRIVDEEGEEMPPGGRGEIVVSGEATAVGYVAGAMAVEGAGFEGGSFRTGDLGFLDADGFLYLVGSKKKVINVGGLKVSPAEVVQVLESHGAVSAGAVVAVKDAQGKNVVTAAVTLDRATAEAELLAFCQARLADYKVPRRIHILDDLPRTASGKVVLRAEDLLG